MEKNKKIIENIIETLKTLIIAIVLALFLKNFVLDATLVSGDSMNDTLATDDLLMVDKISPNFTGYRRGDIVIVKSPDDPEKLFVKRVVGLPNETIDLIDGDFYINGNILDESYTNVAYTFEAPNVGDSHWELGEDEYFLVGDNRIKGISYDSRAFGPIHRDRFVGHARFRIYPFEKFGDIDDN